MPDKSLEQQMQEMLSGLEFKPDDKVWEVVRTEIREDKKRRFAFWWWLLPAILVGGIGAGLYLHKGSGAKQTTPPAITQHAEKPGGKIVQQQQPVNTITDNVNKDADEEKTGTTLSHDQLITSAHTQEKNAQRTVSEKDKEGNFSAGQSKVVQANTTSQKSDLPVGNGQAQSKPVDNILQSQVTSPDTKTEIPGQSVVQEPVVVKTETVLVTKDQHSEPVVQKTDSAATAAPAAVIAHAKKNKAWKFSAVADGSVARLTKAISFLPGANDGRLYADYAVSNPNSGSSQNYIATYRQQTPLKGYSWSIGLRAEKSLNDRFSFITGLQYQYVHYANSTYTAKDSFVYVSASSSFTNAGRITSAGVNVDYSLHYLSIPLLLQYKIAKPVYVFGGLQSSFLLSAKRSEKNIDYLNQSNLTTSGSAKPGFYSYQAALMLGANVAVYDGKKYTWFVAPHIDYGLSKTFKEDLERNNALRYGLQLSIQLKR
ncbi:MAG: PorT family protein [Filimonas sp.]|nr:PorT family protein [Filimonas sp.]